MRHLILCSVLLLTTASILHADQAKPANPVPPTTAETSVYRIAADDVLDITIQDHADLSKTTTVLPDGTISYPYVGEFKAVGLTLREIAERITVALSKEIAGPQVAVTIRSLHERPISQVSILGAVHTPGKHVLKEGWRIFDLLVEAGGLSADRPEAYSATLIRKGTGTIPIDVVRILAATDAKANLLLMPGDVLMVHAADPVHADVQVLGEVARPGTVVIPKDGSIVAILDAAGGPTPRAALSKATITHNGQKNTVDLSGFLSEGKILENVKLVAGDTLFIPQNRLLFSVYGAVAHPGLEAYPDNQKLTALTALSLAGGQAANANLKGAYVYRPSLTGTPTNTKVNLEDIIKKGDLSKDVALQPGDVLYIPSRKSGGPTFLGALSALSVLRVLGL